MDDSTLFECCITNDITELESVNIVDINKRRYRNEWNLLHAACFYGSPETVKYLLDKGSDINYKTASGYNPLILAIISMKIDIVKFLIRKGVNYRHRDKHNNNILHIICIHNNNTKIKSTIKLINYFIKKGVNMEDRNRSNATPLEIAYYYSHIDILKHLIKQGANLNNINFKSNVFIPDNDINHKRNRNYVESYKLYKKYKFFINKKLAKKAFLEIYDEVTHRPGNQGYIKQKDEFENKRKELKDQKEKLEIQKEEFENNSKHRRIE